VRGALALLVALWVAPALAHEGHVHWAALAFRTLDLWIVGPLAVSGTLYARGVTRLWRRLGPGRGVRIWQALSFASGWLLLALALVSPLHRLGERLFTAHMIEHELLMLVAAPLFALSQPLGVLLWAFSPGTRAALGSVAHRRWYAECWSRLSAPLAATVLQAAMLWLWHVPALFERALAREGWHVAQHLCLLLSATLFWWAIDRASRRGGRHGVAGMLLFITALQSGLLGALMAFAGSPWYAQYVALGSAGALADPLADQQIAGLIMWIPGGTVHAAAALLYMSRWFREPPRTTRDSGNAGEPVRPRISSGSPRNS
jgi:putative membrane protein